jgi:hypothetical protein
LQAKHYGQYLTLVKTSNDPNLMGNSGFFQAIRWYCLRGHEDHIHFQLLLESNLNRFPMRINGFRKYVPKFTNEMMDAKKGDVITIWMYGEDVSYIDFSHESKKTATWVLEDINKMGSLNRVSGEHSLLVFELAQKELMKAVPSLSSIPCSQIDESTYKLINNAGYNQCIKFSDNPKFHISKDSCKLAAMGLYSCFLTHCKGSKPHSKNCPKTP